MDKLKKLFKHDKTDSDVKSTPTQGHAPPSSTSSAHAPQTSTATGAAIEKPSGVLMMTSHGDITIALYSDKTPKALLLPSVVQSTI